MEVVEEIASEWAGIVVMRPTGIKFKFDCVF